MPFCVNIYNGKKKVMIMKDYNKEIIMFIDLIYMREVEHLGNVGNKDNSE